MDRIARPTAIRSMPSLILYWIGLDLIEWIGHISLAVCFLRFWCVFLIGMDGLDWMDWIGLDWIGLD